MKKNKISQISSPKNQLSTKDALSSYIEQINQFPILTEEEELELGNRVKNSADKEAAKILIQSHLRLVVKIAYHFKNYGLPIADLIAEGNLGLMQAAKKFDPEKSRFSTYSILWIKTYIQEYILKSWSLVKIGTTIAQKKIFFNLGKIKRKLGINNNQTNFEDSVKQIAKDLNVAEEEVKEMNLRLENSDSSLNNTNDEGFELADSIVAEHKNQEEIAIENQEKLQKEEILKSAFLVLNEREKDILVQRQMTEVSATLEELSQKYQISKERIRQIENIAIEKIKKEISRLKPAKSN